MGLRTFWIALTQRTQDANFEIMTRDCLPRLRNNRSINLNLLDHVLLFAEKYDDRRLKNKVPMFYL